MSMIKKYLKKDIFLHKKDKKLLMIQDYNNNTIMEYQKIKKVSKHFKKINSEIVTNKTDKEMP